MKDRSLPAAPARRARGIWKLLSVLCPFTETRKAITRLFACSLTTYHFWAEKSTLFPVEKQFFHFSQRGPSLFVDTARSGPPSPGPAARDAEKIRPVVARRCAQNLTAVPRSRDLIFIRPKGPAALLRRTSVLPEAKSWRRRNALSLSISISRGIQKEGHDETSCPSFWSGQRGSNSLPPPWQGGALPDELCPRNKGYFNKETPACQDSSSRFSSFSPEAGVP